MTDNKPMAFISVQDVRKRLAALENEWVDTGMDREFGNFEDQGCYILTASGVERVAKVEMHLEFGLVIFPEERPRDSAVTILVNAERERYDTLRITLPSKNGGAAT